jgi:glycosyltransferase involved in cell wall biosynthesis
MACGCPVVALDLGSIPEIVRHGETGFVARDLEELIDGVLMVDGIDREHCRTVALSDFSVERMTDGYEQLFMKILNR